MVLDPQPKRRTRWRFIWPLLLTAGVAVAFVAASASRETRDDLEYVEAMHDELTDISFDSDAFTDVTRRLFSVDRVEFVTVTDSLRSNLAVGLNRIENETPTDILIATHHLYRQTLEAWSAGVSQYTSAILVAADDPENEFVEDQVAEALAAMRAGDDLYVALLHELGMEDVPQPVAPMPQVTMSPAEGSLVTLARTHVTAARSTGNGLALRPGLGVSQLVSDPEMLIGPDGQAAVPATETMVFTVVVTNAGNVLSEEEMLTLTITGGEVPLEMTADVAPLQPGRQTSITFDAVPVAGGLVYEATAALLVTNPDATLDDNQRSVIFLVNEA